MPYRSRLPLPVDVTPTQPLHRLRSEANLRATPGRPIPRLRSLGHISPPPDQPLPPIPIRSPYRLLAQRQGDSSHISSQGYIVGKDSGVAVTDNSYESSSCYSQDEVGETKDYAAHRSSFVPSSQYSEETDSLLRHQPKEICRLDELSHILHLRGSLQEMGATFGPDGEMLTFGNPHLDADVEEMVRLGSLYDKQWHAIFKGREYESKDSELWPDLRVLKKMLHNEGIRFDDRHKRLSYGASYSQPLRLCDKYDIMREQWIEESLKNTHPALRPRRSTKRISPPRTSPKGKPIPDSEEEDNSDRKQRRRMGFLNIVDEEQSSPHGDSAPMIWDSVAEMNSLSLAPRPLFADRSASSALGAGSVLEHASAPRSPFARQSSTPLYAAITVGTVPRATTNTANPDTRTTTDGVNDNIQRRERTRAKPTQTEDEPLHTGDHMSEGSTGSKKSKRLRKWLKAAFRPNKRRAT